MLETACSVLLIETDQQDVLRRRARPPAAWLTRQGPRGAVAPSKC